ncbi:MAG: hypothetical protein CSA62_03900 [Planctomycetota bacterium]|nr:MAG: hypothetical protein CSA62_03900 [Planctomycetota bacterium]
MPIVGVLARVEVQDRQRVWETVQADPALTPFPIEDELERMGILIEAESVEEADRILREQISGLEGVLGSWPVYTDMREIPADEADQLRQGKEGQ